MVVTPRVAVIASHPVQYQAPLFRVLARYLDLHVFYATNLSPAQQAAAAFGVEFDWDVALLQGYDYSVLKNRSKSPNTQTFFGCSTPEISDHLKPSRFDVVITMGWYLKTYIQAIAACSRMKIPIMVRGDSTLQCQKGGLIGGAKKLFYPQLLRNFRAFLVVGKRNRAYLKHFGISEDKMFWSPHAVDNERFHRQSKYTDFTKIQLRARLGCQPGEYLVLFVGQFVSHKRPLDLVEALARIKTSGITVKGAFIGEGEMRTDIRTLADRLRVPVKIVGFKNQSELPRIYAAADALVLPSSRETWGLVVNEAMACGTPAVVSSGVGCSDDLIDPGQTGYSYPAGDITALTQAIVKLVLISNNESVQRALALKMDAYSYSQAADGIVTAVRHGLCH